MEKYISRDNLDALLKSEIEKGTRVIGPVDRDKGLYYESLEDPGSMTLTGEGKPPVRSSKEFLFPRTETVLTYKKDKEGIALETPEGAAATLIVGARPCDSKAVLMMDRVFTWDYDDELYLSRRDATTVMTMQCAGGDESCFCHLVGSSPDDREGSDLYMMPVAEGYNVEGVTEKGEALMKAHEGLFEDAREGAAPTAKAKSDGEPDVAALSQWLADQFEHAAWDGIAVRCLGCGVCAHVCPTCHCFDMVDEPESVSSGARRRNWDSCQIPLFTLHASGHNPRSDQLQRYRQRVMHKFQYFPERFDAILCTGCGRCTRACPSDMDLLAVLEELCSAVEQS